MHVCSQPFYGGKLHRVTAEVKNTLTGAPICKVASEWNASFEFTYPDVSKALLECMCDSSHARMCKCVHVSVYV